MDTNLGEQRTRVQNQLTNTFLKGMDTDTSDMLLGSDQYRYAENVRIVTNKDSDTGELHLIEGTSGFEYKWKSLGEKIIACNSIRDISVFITIGFNGTIPMNWNVYRRDENVKGDSKNDQWVHLFGPCTEKIWTPVLDDTGKDITTINDIRNSITTVIRWESDKNIKLYIADSTGTHTIMSLNVSRPYISSENTVETDFDKLFAYQRTFLPPAKINISSSSGSIVSGKVLYVYRLYLENGSATPLSILSRTLSLYRNEYSGYEALTRSGRAVDINIDIQNKGNLNRILIYRISYQESGEIPKISLIKDTNIDLLFVDDGTNVIEDISISELLSMFTPFIYPKQIESKGDYLFAANIGYSQDEVDKLFKKFDATSYSRHSKFIEDNIQYNVFNVNNNNVSINEDVFLKITLDNLQSAVFTLGNTPTYRELDWKEFTVNGLSYNGYGPNICWRYTYDPIEITPRNLGDIKYLKSTFRCGETYRFGVKLYDKYGRASSVKWIADIIIPDGANMYTAESISIPNLIGGNVSVAKTGFRNVGIEFIKTPGSNWENVYGWEIVRCDRTLRDRKALTQGIIGFPFRELVFDGNGYRKTNLICNPGCISKNPFRFYVYPWPETDKAKDAVSDDEIVLFSSPEYCYLQDDIKDILKSYKNQLYIDEVYNCTPLEEFSLDNVKVRTKNTYDNNSYIEDDKSYWMSVSNMDFTTFGTGVSNNERAYYFNIVTRNTNNQESGWRVKDTSGRVEVTTLYFLNYFNPDYYTFESPQYKNIQINDMAFAESPKSSDFARDEMLLYKNNITTIDNLLFINWTTPLALNLSNEDELNMKNAMDNINDPNTYICYIDTYPVGSGGKCILLKQSNSSNKIKIEPLNKLHAPKITVANINKPTVPYNGYNKTSINNSSYISFGDYTENDSISVYSGDTKNRIFTYHAAHNWYNETYKQGIRMACIYAIPVETDIDIQAQYGDLYGVDNFDYRVLDTSDALGTYTLSKSAYMYNTVYNATPDIVEWTVQELLNSKSDQFDTRVHYSNAKTNNERIDSWLQFQAGNYIDVDTRYGEITDLKLFKDKLIFWQENATGILAVNERVVLNDQNDTQVVLGTGGVLERYDYFTTVYGQKKNLHVRTMSNTSLYWWDGNNKEILLYQQKYDITPLSTVKHIRNYINDRDESTTPFMTYDSKYKEVLMNVVNNECVVYNEYIEAFTSVYKFNPLYEALVNGKLYLTDTEAVYKYNSSDGEKSELFSDIAIPYIKYVVNYQPTYNKVFDIQTFGGRFYEGKGYIEQNNETKGLSFDYKTPLKQHSCTDYKDVVTDREYDFRLTIPRNMPRDEKQDWGDRMRGKTMQCEIKSNSNNLDFALQYVTTKFRMSWT